MNRIVGVTAVFLAGCSNPIGPFSLCTTTSSERVSPSAPVDSLDGLSVNAWFEAIEPGLSWDITWSDVQGAPAVDTLTLSIERRGRPTVEEEEPTNSGESDGVCLQGPYVRNDVRVRLSTASGATGQANGSVILLGPDLSDATLFVDVPIEGPDWLVPADQGVGCEGSPQTMLTVGAESSLTTMAGSLEVLQNNCRAGWGTWDSVDVAP